MQQELAVLDLGLVRLEETMGGDAAVLRAARLCRGREGQGDTERDAKLLAQLVAARPAHNTVFEHAVARFYVKAPLFVARQWMRHRIGSYCEVSRRSTEAPLEFHIPGVSHQGNIAGMVACLEYQEMSRRATVIRPEALEEVYRRVADRFQLEGKDRMGLAQLSYAFACFCAHTQYRALLEGGWPQERARLVLPVSLYTEFVWTVNGWSLLNFLEKRLHPAAQIEMQHYAWALWRLLGEWMPLVAAGWRKAHEDYFTTATMPEGVA